MFATMYGTLVHLALGAALAGSTPVVSAHADNRALRFTTDTTVSATSKAAPSKTYLEVDNSAFLDADVFALQGYRRVRLGTVTGLTTQKLEIPRYLVDPGLPLRFIIDPIGGRRNSVSDELVVYQGDTVSLFVPPF